MSGCVLCGGASLGFDRSKSGVRPVPNLECGRCLGVSDALAGAHGTGPTPAACHRLRRRRTRAAGGAAHAHDGAPPSVEAMRLRQPRARSWNSVAIRQGGSVAAFAAPGRRTEPSGGTGRAPRRRRGECHAGQPGRRVASRQCGRAGLARACGRNADGFCLHGGSRNLLDPFPREAAPAGRALACASLALPAPRSGPSHRRFAATARPGVPFGLDRSKSVAVN